MSAASSLTARIMETWAHGQDVADALGLVREPTARLRHIAHIGVRALPFSFAANGLEVPQEPVRVELTGPDGSVWTWGPEHAANRVTGPALDFCLIVTQRRHLADTSIRAYGQVADQWLAIAQAFAGPPGPGPPAGLRAASGLTPSPTGQPTSAFTTASPPVPRERLVNRESASQLPMSNSAPSVRRFHRKTEKHRRYDADRGKISDDSRITRRSWEGHDRSAGGFSDVE